MAQSVLFYSHGASLFIDVEESPSPMFTEDISSHRAHGNIAKLKQ